MGIWDQYKTDQSLEESGVWKPFGDYQVKIARAGVGNPRYEQALERHAKSARHRKMSVAEMQAISLDMLVTHCVKGWKTKVDGEWEDGIELADGSIVPATREVLLQVFEQIPNLREAIQRIADDYEEFKAEEREEAAGN